MSGLLLDADQIDAAHAAILGEQGALDRISYLAGYAAALRDIGNNALAFERIAIIFADKIGSANRSYEAGDNDWLKPVVLEAMEYREAARIAAPRRSQSRLGWVYVLDDGAGRVKIGFTRGDVQKRATTIQAASGCDLTIVGQFQGTMADEKATHERFAAARIRGEWFRRTSEIAAWITGLTT